MHLVQYLMCVTTRHKKARDAYLEELQQLRDTEKTGRKKMLQNSKYENELLLNVIDSIRDRPVRLKLMTYHAIGMLAYILKAKMATDPCIEGYEIVDQMVCNPERTIDYVKALGELADEGWIRIFERQGMAFTDQPPFCWLQSYLDLGDTFHLEMGEIQNSCNPFSTNDAYLDNVFSYLHSMIQDDGKLYRVNEPEIDLATLQPEGWFRRIVQRVQITTSSLPAAEVQKKYSLSVYQYLLLIGLLGMREGDVRYDFSAPSDVTYLFAQGRICRKRMKDHLFDKKSPLMRHRLIEGTNGKFGESVQLTQNAIAALIGKPKGKNTTQELKTRVKKHTLFDVETPKLKTDSLQLPPPVMEAIRSLLFSESLKGKQIRKGWQSSLPTAWGSPTGSTVLLYGPPGTGKTLTAQYLASELKRPLLKIDAARVLSCWVGESEQNVRRIFEDYSDLNKEFGTAPVLLLNEADQLLGARGAGSNAVDRMNNNMQNLFLEGLERFAGIMVATTNRRDLLDEAFSRRFTYKLELPPPDRNIRIALWKSILPMKRLASDVDITQLAEMGLTGGEIRLVVERVVRLLAFRGITTIDYKIVTDIAKEELTSRMKRYGGMNKIGFAADRSS